MSDASDASDFASLLFAAMTDAAVEGKACQLQACITPPGKTKKIVRIIVVPEEMDYVRSDTSATFKKPL